jgi:phenylpropionate dioxygenase-like ring-hydroxylating dioxygenase large terminal subunit
MPWYVACASSELRERPLARAILDVPLVIFRGPKPAALLDRCAHRNIPLSEGRCVDGRLECRYHGWQYGESGRCLKIPGLPGEADREVRAVPRFATREQDGFVWVYSTPDVEPAEAPYTLPALEPGESETRRTVDVEAPLLATLENALDVPHTAVLHKGLFRGSRPPIRIKARVTRTPEGVQAEYLGEPRPSGWAAKILAPAGGDVVHFDRFLRPSIAQVEYRLGTSTRLLVTSICAPLGEFRTRIHAVVRFRTPLPGWLLKLILRPFATRIFEQDRSILKSQGEALRRWKGEHYASTPIDVLGLQIARILKGSDAGEDWSREIEMEV